MIQTTTYNEDFNLPSSDFEGQNAHMKFIAVIQYDAVQGSEESHRLISVNMQGSAVAASISGQLAHDSDDLRGWFLTNATVGISVLNEPSFMCVSDSPSTWMGGGELTSSSSVSLSESLGVFGTDPTASISGGVSFGTSFTTELPNFIVLNLTDQAVVKHVYEMASSDGGSYSKYSDLCDTSAGGQFKGDPLFGIPYIAIGNLPLVSQATFVGDFDPNYAGVVLQLELTAVLQKVEKTFKFFTVDINGDTKTTSYTHTLVVPFVNCKPPS